MHRESVNPGKGAANSSHQLPRFLGSKQSPEIRAGKSIKI
jgi:hypothetical protein